MDNSARVNALVEKILNTQLSEDSEWERGDEVVVNLAIYLNHFAEFYEFEKQQRSIRKSNKTLKPALTKAKALQAVLDDLIILPDAGPDLEWVFSKMQSAAPHTLTLPPHLRYIYDFYSHKGEAGSTEKLLFPALHLLEFRHSLVCLIESLSSEKEYGNPDGRPERDLAPLVLHLKVDLMKYWKEKSDNEKSDDEKPDDEKSDREVAHCIHELIQLIDIQVSRKTIRNILADHSPNNPKP